MALRALRVRIRVRVNTLLMYLMELVIMTRVETMGIRVRIRVFGEKAIDDGVNRGVAKGEDLAGRGGDDDGDVGAAQDAEFASFFEYSGTALGEG
ncbi:unnamed protein product [Camellia sinensis]